MSGTPFTYLEKPGPGYLGWTVWNNRVDGAYIRMEPDLSDALSRKVALHEIGHALHLMHYQGDDLSIMSIHDDGGEEITCIDLLQFCQLWDCIPKCSLTTSPIPADSSS